MTTEHSPLKSDTAIIGMSALFAGAKDLAAYWQNILDKVNSISDSPDDQILPYYDPEITRNDRIYTRKGGFIHGLADFNPVDYGIMPNAVDGGSPDQYLALRLSKAALRDAGYENRPFNRERTGVIFGNGSYLNRGFANIFQHGVVIDQTLEMLQQLAPHLDPNTVEDIRNELKASLPPFNAEICPGLIPNNLTGRVANRLDLMGPNYVLDGACASSLIATRLAIDELQNHRCDMILAGGVNASLQPPVMMLFTQLGALAHGDILPFSANANGTLLGEGVGIVVMKRLEDAERDGDRIYAVIKGVGIASDGKGLSPVAPRLEGERLAVQRAYGEAGIDPSTVSLIEAHGTGIPLGDRTEVKMLGQIFGTRDGIPPIALGSVKSMVAHTITASGIAGLIKTALALHHKVLPPTLLDHIHSDLNLEDSPFYINNQTRPWIHGTTAHPRRAGVNAFGFGGINSHVVLEEYIPKDESVPQPSLYGKWPTELFLLGAQSRSELEEQLTELIQHLENHSDRTLADWSYTLAQTATRKGTFRVALVAESLDDLQKKLAIAQRKLRDPAQSDFKIRSGVFYAEQKDLGPIAFLFPGEGAQYSNMLLDLCLYFPGVRKWFDLLDSALPARFLSLHQPVPSAIVFPPPTALSPEELQQIDDWLMGMELGPATLFVAGMALFELLDQFGVKPNAMVGHSSGENTALVASQHLTYATRSQLIESIAMLNQTIKGLEDADQVPTGAMLAIGGLSGDVVRKFIDEKNQGEGQPVLEIAVDNCANQTVLFGDVEPIQAALQYLTSQGGICRILPFNRAYHTPRFASISDVLRQTYEALDVKAGHTPLYSCVTAKPFPAEPEAIRDLMAAQWHSLVRFRETIEALYNDGFKSFIEVGPSGNLTAFVEDILRNQDHLALSSNSRHRSGLSQLQMLLARVFVQGLELDVSPLYSHRVCQLIDLEAPVTIPSPEMKLQLRIPRLRFSEEQLKRLQNLIPHNSQSSFHQQASKAAIDWPLLGTVLEHDQQHLLCRREFNLNRDCFLQDHVFGGKVSDNQPDLQPLSLLPITFSIEILAEAASLLTGGLGVIRLKKIRAHRWLALDRGSLLLETIAERLADVSGSVSVVFVRIYCLEGEARVLAVQGEVELGHQLPQAPVPCLSLTNPQPVVTTEDIIYGSGMFHGPRLQGIRRLGQWSTDGIEATLTTLPTHDFFDSGHQPSFHLDPGLLDAAGQLITYWLVEQFGANHAACFPFFIDSIEIFSTPLAPNTHLECLASIKFMSSQLISANFELRDLGNKVIIRITGWQDIHFEGPKNNFNSCRFNPRDEFLSVPLMQVESGLFCREIEPFSAFLQASNGIWLRMLAHLMLNEAERTTWYILPEHGPRRAEWLLGRIAAKDAVRQWVQQTFNISLAPADVEIKASPQGKPYAISSCLGDVPIPDISISHSQGHAVATMASHCGVHIGVDFQNYRFLQDHDLLSSAFTEQEQNIIQQAVTPEQQFLVTLGIWCAKEAAAKSAGTGLMGHPKNWHVESYSVGFDEIMILDVNDQTFPVRLWYTDQHVLAICEAS
jgi:acyl transferase domain-containing protein/phosphopantetheinyl transferase